MDRSAFIKTLKEVLKYDRKYRTIESRDQLLRLIGRARVNFVPQYEFANHGRSYQHWEIVELRVPVPLLEIAEENKKILEELVEYVYLSLPAKLLFLHLILASFSLITLDK